MEDAAEYIRTVSTHEDAAGEGRPNLGPLRHLEVADVEPPRRRLLLPHARQAPDQIEAPNECRRTGSVDLASGVQRNACGCAMQPHTNSQDDDEGRWPQSVRFGCALVMRTTPTRPQGARAGTGRKRQRNCGAVATRKDS